MHDLDDSWTLPSVSKEREVIVFAKSDKTDGLRVPQVSRSPKVAIFVPTTTTTDIQTDRFTLACACAHRVTTLSSLTRVRIKVTLMQNTSLGSIILKELGSAVGFWDR